MPWESADPQAQLREIDAHIVDFSRLAVEALLTEEHV
jgi:hypothetical protein